MLGNRAMRLIRIDGFRVESVPEGYFLMLRNRDVPGVVGTVGTLLGQAQVNIAGLELGRDRAGGIGAQSVRGRRSGAGRGARSAKNDARDYFREPVETLTSLEPI